MKRIEVAAAVICHKGKIFVTQRGYGEFKDGWEFPGGKIEPGESPEQALIREIREELDTEVEVGELADTVEYEYPRFHLTLYCYYCRVISGNLELKEHEAARWLSADELDSVDWLPADVDLIHRLKARKKLAVLFPGVGYTCARPLLYYTASEASEHGYEVMRLDYGEDIHSFRGRTPEELVPVAETAEKRALEQLKTIDFSQYREILMISKSIGTAVACRTGKILNPERWGIRLRHFLMTPIPATVREMGDIEGCFVAGTADPYISRELVLEAAASYPEQVGAIFEDCNHSLEKPGDTEGNLNRVLQTVKLLSDFIDEKLQQQC